VSAIDAWIKTVGGRWSKDGSYDSTVIIDPQILTQ
jgi:hypothetical protein